MSKLALVTGATAGIGEAISIKLAKEGYDLIITGRRQERLNEFKQKLEQEFKISVQSLCFDIRNKNEVDNAVTKIERIGELEILVNNAGLAAGLSPIQEGDMVDWERMIDTNIKGLLYISRQIMPYFVKKQERSYCKYWLYCRDAMFMLMGMCIVLQSLLLTHLHKQ